MHLNIVDNLEAMNRDDNYLKRDSNHFNSIDRSQKRYKVDILTVKLKLNRVGNCCLSLGSILVGSFDNFLQMSIENKQAEYSSKDHRH